MRKISVAVFSALAAVLLAAPAVSSAQEAKRLEAEPQKPAAQPAERQMEITVAGASSEREAKALLQADTLLARCVIKPVMTDAEIDTCKTAYRLHRQAQAQIKR